MNRRAFLSALAAIPAAALLPLPTGGVAPTAPSLLAGTVGFAVGDVFTISGVYAVNPMTRLATAHQQQFVVTTVESSGAIVTMWPTIYADGPYMNATAPTDESRIEPKFTMPADEVLPRIVAHEAWSWHWHG